MLLPPSVILATILGAAAQSSPQVGDLPVGYIGIFLNAGAIGLWALFYFLRKVVTPQEQRERLEAQETAHRLVIAAKEEQIARLEQEVDRADARAEREHQEVSRLNGVLEKNIPIMESNMKLLEESALIIHDYNRDHDLKRAGK